MVTRFVGSRRPIGEYYGFAWWATLLYGAASVITIVLVLGLLIFFGRILVHASRFGWLILLLVALWALYAVVGYLSMYTPVVISENGFFVRVVFWWLKIPWQDVLRMRYATFPNHVVSVRGTGPIPGLLFLPSLKPEDSVFLVPGLSRRSELFETMRHHASDAQGQEIPVTTIVGRPPARR